MQSRAVEVAARSLQAAREAPHRDHIPLLNGGIRTDKAPADLEVNEAVALASLHVVAGRLVVDTGYVPFGSVYLGTSQGTFEAFYGDGTEVLLLFTTTTVYTWNPTVLQWQVVSLDAIRLTTAAEVAGSNTFDLDDVSDITVGSVVGITLDNGVQLITDVTNVAASTITTTAVVPVGRSVALGADVFLAPALNGDPALSQISAVIFPGNEWIIFSNGVDPVMYYLGGIVAELPGLPVNTTCHAIAVFHETVLLGNTTENGTHLSARVRQSDLGDPSEWTAGIAAIYDLLDTDDSILVLEPLGPWMIAYREFSVMRASYLGILNQILLWEYMVQSKNGLMGEGAQSQGAVANVGSAHIMVGHAGIYRYQGGYTLDQIGDGIFNSFLAAQGDFNTPARNTLFTMYVPDLQEVWVVYPAVIDGVPSDVPNKMLRVQLRNNSWSERFFDTPFYAMGPFLPFGSTTWATAMGQWNSTEWARPWDSRSLTQNVPSILLCPAAEGGDGSLQMYEYRAQTDGGVAIEWTLTTKQFGDGSQFSRWERVDVVAIGSDVLLEVSEDEGATFDTVGTFDFGASAAPTAKGIWLDRVSTRLQLRMSGTDPTFSLRYMDLSSIAETEW